MEAARLSQQTLSAFAKLSGNEQTEWLAYARHRQKEVGDLLDTLRSAESLEILNAYAIGLVLAKLL